ncbi:MAG TPA: hypothetical protein VJS69_08145 [Candidatus Krumholzibacteria bacterium]|nr:hypothetical protein [Candidatus Krumholzibacteria bacterium]
MKTKLIVAAIVALACLPSLAFGDGYLSLYSDASHTDCALSDTAPAVANVYMVDFGYAINALRFRIAASPGFTGAWLSETSPFTTIGNSQTDMSMSFGSCLIGQVLVLTMTYQLFGTSTCSQLSVEAPSGLSDPICLDCSFGTECAGYFPLHVNCSGSFGCDPLPVKPTTWGSVKALYR